MDSNIIQQYPLITPEELSGKIEASSETITFLQNSRKKAKNIIYGLEDQILVVVGPCSIHDPLAALDYAKKLKSLNDCYKEHVMLVMRAYFEKPRTSLGWKGLIYDPHLNNSNDITAGLNMARQLLLDINALGVPVASEFVDTLIPQYIYDLVTWGAIGARTSESQIHRQLASSLPLPIGFKNSMSGDIQIAVNAVRVAQQPHTFLNINAQGIVSAKISKGNPNCHIILRGARHNTNYDEEHIKFAIEKLRQYNLNPFIMVDCSHGNSDDTPSQQAKVIDSVCEYLKNPANSKVGVMIESNVVSGKQAFKPGEKHRYGQSITDGCVSWEETELFISKLVNAVKVRTQITANAHT